MNTLDTNNPNCFTYQTEELLIELLGGVRIDTLDRMRLTIKVSVINRKHPKYTSELSGLAVRHNLDLYNDNQVEKFVRRVAEKLEVGSVAITKAIADITTQLEAYRLTQLDKKDDKPVRKLSEQEREEALQFLQSKNLLQATNDMIGKSGVIGEEVNRLLPFSAGCTSLLRMVYFSSHHHTQPQKRRSVPRRCLPLGDSADRSSCIRL